MGVLATIERDAVAPERRATGLTWDSPELQEAFGVRSTRSGVAVNEKTALNLSPVFAAVRRLSEDVAKTPRGVFERMERGRERVGSHRVDQIIGIRPNPEMTAFTFFEALQGHIATWGNAYAEIERDRGGRALALWPLTPNRVRKERRSDGSIVYWVRITRDGDDQVELALSPDRILHVPGFGFDGFEGYSVIKLARESLGLTSATEAFGAEHFGSGSRIAGVLQTEKKFSSPEDKRLIRKDWETMHKGLDNAHRVAILDQGLTWQQIGVPPEDSQFLETRKFQVSEVARWFLMPPHKLMDLERATFSNIEHQAIEYVQDTMMSWFTRWEQALGWDLFTNAERGRLYVRFNQNALLRGDSAARGAFYNQMFQLGALSTNDIRELEEMNPVDGGDERFVPRNMMTLEEAAEPMPAPTLPTPPEPDDDEEEPTDERKEVRESREARERRSVDDRMGLRERHRALFEREASTVVSREATAIRAILNKAFGGRQIDRLAGLLDEFFDTHPDWIAERFRTVLLTYGANVAAVAASEVDTDVPADLDGFTTRYAATMGRRWTASSAGQLRAIIRDTDPNKLEDVIEERLQEWEARRPAKVARREVVEAGEAVAAFVWKAGGVTRMRWSTIGSNCVLCNKMAGRVVAIEGAFLRAGDVLDPEDDDTAPLRPRGTVRHPPLHDGCDCVIVPD